MANEQNLVPLDQRSKSEQRAIQSKGGTASGVSRRRRAGLRDIFQEIADGQITDDKAKKKLQALGITEENLNNTALIATAVFKKALKGDAKAVETWIAMSEKQDDTSNRYELPARVIGRAFSDINREIVPNYDYIFKGGRGGLKSSYVSLKIIELIKNNPTMHGCVVRKVASTLKDSVFAQLKWAIHELGLDDEFKTSKNPMEIEYKKTGQKIFFRGCDDPIKLKSIKPEFGYIGILWIEERDQLDGAEGERSVRQSVLRGGAECYFFASYNPPKSANNWVNKELLTPDPKRIVHHSTYLDAPVAWLGQKFIDDAEHLKEVNPSAYEHEYGGVANGQGGLVFDNLEVREITDDEIATFDRVYQGVDWGWYPDPYAFIRLAYVSATETIYIYAEHVVNKQSNAHTAEWIEEQGYNDYVITCDSAENKSVNDYKDLGLPAKPAIKGAGSVEYSFKWLCCRHIVIDQARCPRATEEFVNYEYERDKDGNVISGYPDKNNHTIDAVRYATEQYWTRRGNQA